MVARWRGHSMEFGTIRYETIDNAAVARIVMNRPEVRNAQDEQMTYELNEAFSAASLDDEVKVIVLSGEGPHFSAGHDIRGKGDPDYEHDPVFPWSSTLPGSEGMMNRAQEVFFRMARRWHDIPKPTIAQVHGKVIAGGLLLMWVCDLIIASEDAEFIDIGAGPQFMVNGSEWFSHPWELGIRKAKEMLFTAEPVSAQEAYNLGMVNHVVPREEQEEFTNALASRIAARSSFGLALAKMACNQARDAQGFWTSHQSAFNLWALGHSHERVLTLQRRLEEAGLPTDWTPGRGV